MASVAVLLAKTLYTTGSILRLQLMHAASGRVTFAGVRVGWNHGCMFVAVAGLAFFLLARGDDLADRSIRSLLP